MHLALAEYTQRLGQFGARDRKNTYSWNKYMKSNKNLPACEAILLFNKTTGNQLAVEKVKDVIHTEDSKKSVTLPRNTYGYTLDVAKMTLASLTPNPITRNLRMVSVTGENRKIQSLRLHMDSKSVFGGSMKGQPNTSSADLTGGGDDKIEAGFQSEWLGPIRMAFAAN